MGDSRSGFRVATSKPNACCHCSPFAPTPKRENSFVAPASTLTLIAHFLVPTQISTCCNLYGQQFAGLVSTMEKTCHSPVGSWIAGERFRIRHSTLRGSNVEVRNELASPRGSHNCHRSCRGVGDRRCCISLSNRDSVAEAAARDSSRWELVLPSVPFALGGEAVVGDVDSCKCALLLGFSGCCRNLAGSVPEMSS